MRFTFPERYRPLLIVAVIGAIGLAFYIGNFVFAEPTERCCATEWDPTPYQQTPARTLP